MSGNIFYTFSYTLVGVHLKCLQNVPGECIARYIYDVKKIFALH